MAGTVSFINQQKPEDVRNYWTKERMMNAKPMAMGIDSSGSAAIPSVFEPPSIGKIKGALPSDDCVPPLGVIQGAPPKADIHEEPPIDKIVDAGQLDKDGSIIKLLLELLKALGLKINIEEPKDKPKKDLEEQKKIDIIDKPY